MNFYSHDNPKVLLKKHLQEVANRSREIIQKKNIENIDKTILADISYLIGISHDFGKYTSFFQKNRIDKIPIENENLGNHSLISAFFTLEILQEYVNSKNLIADMPLSYIPQIGYFIVKHHHGNLDNVKNDIDSEKLFHSGFRLIPRQLKDIENNSQQIISEYNYLLESFGISISSIKKRMNKYKQSIRYDEDIKPIIKNSLKIPTKKMIKENNVVFYIFSQLLYSVLIDSDKKNAGKVRSIARKKLPENLVDRYLKQQKFIYKNQSKINPLRNQIRKSVLKNLNSSNKIFTITAPTGTGKTLTSLSAALKLRKMIKKDLKLDYEPRIIYSLPFTSIIDQNFDVFDKVFQQLEDFNNHQSEYLLKHHYLADVFYKTPKRVKKIEVDESLALIESWESELIVTTFIQLFHTLIGYKNRMLKKFHNIVNSIIILDEVQNIPLKYWSLVHDVLIALTQYFNCRIILMTATKPLIFNEGKDDFKELVSDYKQFFQSDELNRVKLNYLKSQTIDEFYNNLPDFNLDSYLFVFNTINSSVEFFKKIKEISEYKKFYLSTNIIPKERKKRVEDIKELIDGNRKTNKTQKFIVVSTQMIEAGVDIDCECAYRDLGPLDSIIQVAGRCNRNNKLDNKGTVNIIRLKKNENYYFCRIYDPILIGISENILKKKNRIQETDFLELIEDYFSLAKKRMYEEKNLIKSLKMLNYHDKEDNIPISSFKLIDENYYKQDIFVETCQAAIEVWKRFECLQEISDFYKRKLEFLKFRKEFYEYVISIPKKCLPFGHESAIYHLRKDRVNEYYDEETGFRIDKVLPPEKSVEIL